MTPAASRWPVQSRWGPPRTPGAFQWPAQSRRGPPVTPAASRWPVQSRWGPPGTPSAFQWPAQSKRGPPRTPAASQWPAQSKRGPPVTPAASLPYLAPLTHRMPFPRVLQGCALLSSGPRQPARVLQGSELPYRTSADHRHPPGSRSPLAGPVLDTAANQPTGPAHSPAGPSWPSQASSKRRTP